MQAILIRENTLSKVIAGLDIGTCSVRAVVGIINDDYSVEIVDVAKKPSNGFLRNGTIVNLESTKNCIKEIIDDVEQNAGLEVQAVVTGIGGVQIESLNSKGAVAISSYGKTERAVNADDMRRVIDCANSVKIPLDRNLLHVIPQGYFVDGTDVGKNPLNQIAYKLEAEVHIITASRTAVSNITNCMEQTKYPLDEVMLKTLACTEAVMVDDERKLGSILIDIGGGTTDVVVIVNDAPICTCSIPVGGNLVTSDISMVKNIPSSIAEKLKVESGCCWLPLVENSNEEVIIPGFGSRSSELTTKVELALIIEARMKEIFEMVRSEIKPKLSGRKFAGSIILTGGGAQLPGCLEMAQSVFQTSSVRLGVPQPLGGMENNYRYPEYATAVGLILAHKEHLKSAEKEVIKKKHSEPKKTGEESIISKLMKKFF
ncbi:MAG: cell division protein FtsA [Treponema sp.]|nr:cell division protein FtsA [Candidatus Treponema equifaecale]